MTDDRFQFGENWSRFLTVLDDDRISAAEESLRSMLGRDSLEGLHFLDVGSGSGLFSLAAHRLRATVHSFDYDPQSVACTEELRRRYSGESPEWTIEQGSALDADYLSGLKPADIIYSWGVLHHTGDMWTAIDLVSKRVKPSGQFWLAIYNDQGPATANWIRVKKLYQRLPKFLRPVLCVIVGGLLFAHRICRAAVSSLVHLLTFINPLAPFRSLSDKLQQPDPRGMSRWYDLVDWVGGWPFEVAKPEEIVDFLQSRSFTLERMKTVGGNMGCNEFVFRRDDAN